MTVANPSLNRDADIADLLDAILSLDREERGEAAIPYRPKFRAITGSVTGAILLQQIWFRFKQKGYKPFYKFLEPCGHEKYRDGDSWIEELGFSADEFGTALKKVGTKVTTGTSKTDAYDNSIVIYWTDSDRVTYYDMNLINFANAISRAYDESALGKSALSDYLDRLALLVYPGNPAGLDLEVNGKGRFTSSSESSPERTSENLDASHAASEPPAAASDLDSEEVRSSDTSSSGFSAPSTTEGESDGSESYKEWGEVLGHTSADSGMHMQTVYDPRACGGRSKNGELPQKAKDRQLQDRSGNGAGAKRIDEWEQQAAGFLVRLLHQLGTDGVEMDTFMKKKTTRQPFVSPINYIDENGKNVIVGSLAQVMEAEGEMFNAWAEEFVTHKSTPVRNAGTRVRALTVLDWIKNNYPTYLAYKAQALKPKKEPEYEEYKAGFSIDWA